MSAAREGEQTGVTVNALRKIAPRRAKAIEVGCLDLAITVGPDCPLRLVVGVEKDDVGARTEIELSGLRAVRGVTRSMRSKPVLRKRRSRSERSMPVCRPSGISSDSVNSTPGDAYRR